MYCPWFILCPCLFVMTNSYTVVDILLDMKQQANFDYLLLMRNRNQTGHERDLMEELQVPLIRLDEQVSYFLHNKMSLHLLSVVEIHSTNFEESRALLKALESNLRHMTTTRVLFLLEMVGANETLLQELFTYCWKLKILNALAVFTDFEKTNLIFGYSHFPIFQLEQRLYEPGSSRAIYPARLENLQGFNLTVILGGTTPRLIAYYNKRGEVVYEGTVGHFMGAFQQRFNCRFVQPYSAQPKSFAPSSQTVAAVRNQTVEISMSLTFPTIPPYGYSYPFEQMNWCLMLPVEADVPTPEFYTNVFELHAFLLTLCTLILISILLASSLKLHGYQVYLHEFLLHDSCLRGVLGQSFCEVFRAPVLVRGIYLKICVLGILITVWYNSYFSTYVTSAPKRLPYRSYDDVLASGKKVVAWKPEYNELLGRLQQFRKYEPMFLVEPDFNRYIQMRDSFNTEFGYMMTTTKWVIVNEQQRVFSKPLFRMREDFCFFNNVPFGFPVHENSIYMEPIKKLILQLDASGLSSHWRAMGFTELIESGELDFLDLSPRREFRAMQLIDLQYIWYGYAFMTILSTLVWAMELIWYKLERRRRLTLMKKMQCKN